MLCIYLGILFLFLHVYLLYYASALLLIVPSSGQSLIPGTLDVPHSLIRLPDPDHPCPLITNSCCTNFAPISKS